MKRCAGIHHVMNHFAIFGTLTFGFLASVLASPMSISEIGPHENILRFEKNENPQNVMMVYTQLDKSCRFVMKKSSPVFDFYWLMDGKSYKPVHPLIKSGVRDRLEIADPNSSAFLVRLNDLSELRNDLPKPEMKVAALNQGNQCKVEATVRLGPSDHGALMILNSIYAESERSILPPFRKVVAVTLTGTDAVTGVLIKRKYTAY